MASTLALYTSRHPRGPSPPAPAAAGWHLESPSGASLSDVGGAADSRRLPRVGDDRRRPFGRPERTSGLYTFNVAGEQIVRTKKRYQFHAALPAHLDGRERARLNLRPLVVLVNGVEAAREALAAAKANKGRGRPGSIECVKFVFGGPPPLDSPDAWPQDRVAAWMQANVDWVQTCAGPHAVIATVFYYPDERSRYQHLLLIPITDKGRLSWTALERKFALTPEGALQAHPEFDAGPLPARGRQAVRPRAR